MNSPEIASGQNHHLPEPLLRRSAKAKGSELPNVTTTSMVRQMKQIDHSSPIWRAQIVQGDQVPRNQQEVG
jgi:hypothetical protein